MTLLWQELPKFPETQKLSQSIRSPILSQVESLSSLWLERMAKYDDHRQFENTVAYLTGWKCLVNEANQSFLVAILAPEKMNLQTVSLQKLDSFCKGNTKILLLREGFSVTVVDNLGVGMTFKVADGLLRGFPLSPAIKV